MQAVAITKAAAKAAKPKSSYSQDSGSEYQKRDASYYSKGTYRSTAEPVLKLASVTQAATDAELKTNASLAGQLEVNFKSETFPGEDGRLLPDWPRSRCSETQTGAPPGNSNRVVVGFTTGSARQMRRCL